MKGKGRDREAERARLRPDAPKCRRVVVTAPLQGQTAPGVTWDVALHCTALRCAVPYNDERLGLGLEHCTHNSIRQCRRDATPHSTPGSKSCHGTVNHKGHRETGGGNSEVLFGESVSEGGGVPAWNETVARPLDRAAELAAGPLAGQQHPGAGGGGS